VVVLCSSRMANAEGDGLWDCKISETIGEHDRLGIGGFAFRRSQRW